MSESNNNEEFVYPELTGRRRIYSDVDKITKGNIFEVLQKAMIVHMQNSNEMVFLTIPWIEQSSWLKTK